MLKNCYIMSKDKIFVHKNSKKLQSQTKKSKNVNQSIIVTIEILKIEMSESLFPFEKWTK